MAVKHGVEKVQERNKLKFYSGRGQQASLVLAVQQLY